MNLGEICVKPYILGAAGAALILSCGAAKAQLKVTAASRGLPLSVLPWLFADDVPEKVRQLSAILKEVVP